MDFAKVHWCAIQEFGETLLNNYGYIQVSSFSEADICILLNMALCTIKQRILISNIQRKNMKMRDHYNSQNM